MQLDRNAGQAQDKSRRVQPPASFFGAAGATQALDLRPLYALRFVRQDEACDEVA